MFLEESQGKSDLHLSSASADIAARLMHSQSSDSRRKWRRYLTPCWLEPWSIMESIVVSLTQLFFTGFLFQLCLLNSQFCWLYKSVDDPSIEQSLLMPRWLAVESRIE